MTETDYLRTTRDGYDAIAVGYAKRFGGQLAVEPVNLAMLGLFARVATGLVVDIGCGQGRVAAHLAGLGLDVSGVDLSPEMIALARKTYPHLRFDVGTMTGLALGDGVARGLLAWYSTIHVPDEDLPRVFAEFHRVLAPGGQALLAFQVGDEPLLVTEAFGQTVTLEFRRRQPQRVAELLETAGLPVWSTTVWQPDGEGPPQAYLFARRKEN